MIKWIQENKWKIVSVIAVYLIICVSVIGGFMTSLHFSEDFKDRGFNTKLEATTDGWMTYALKPFTVIGTMFDGGKLQEGYLTVCGIFLVVFIWMSVKLILKSRKTHEYQGEEHGSSAWSKNGEEYRKLPDGSQILNKTEGFILGKNHYLGTDPKKVKVNKNILVVQLLYLIILQTLILTHLLIANHSHILTYLVRLKL